MSGTVRNILFVMVDQLRWDYLSCYGHPHLATPNIDWLAENGVRFEHAYAQSPVCGPSRACVSTGRYMSSHGVMSNMDPMPLDEKLIGEYLRPLGMRTAVVGKSEHRPDLRALERLGIDKESEIGRKIIYRDLDPYDRDGGMNPTPILRSDLKYNAYLRAQGYDSENSWQEWTQAVIDDDGEVRDGRIWSNAKYPSRLPDEHSESAYVTNRAMQFMTETGNQPWCLQLGYYKPHWPYVASDPYHKLYPPETHLPLKRSNEELEGHPYLAAFQRLRLSSVYRRQGARDVIVQAYMGLVKQVDDHFGRLLTYMRSNGLLENTLIVFTSDHGDNLGDHWCGEKDIPHDSASRVPFLVYDPRGAADTTRGTVEPRFVELIDVLPTLIEAAGGELEPHQHRLEGRSLQPLLHGQAEVVWRDHVFSEFDFSLRSLGLVMERPLEQTRGYMVRNKRWKYATFEGETHPMLFDMQNDPNEMIDLGDSAEHEQIRVELSALIFSWLRRLKRRTTVLLPDLENRYGPVCEDRDGVLIGWWEDKFGNNFDKTFE